MKTRTRTEIIVETCRVLTIKRLGSVEPAWCEQCDKPTPMVSADEAAIICRISARAVYLRVEANEFHFTETPDGLLLICANSLGIGDQRS